MTPKDQDTQRLSILQGDCREVLKTLPDESVHCCVTSPPYWGLRSYLPNGHECKSLELGSESTLEDYITNMVDVFREVHRVLRRDGTLWLNLGDVYATDTKWGGSSSNKNEAAIGDAKRTLKRNSGLKPKDLVLLPARAALALQADGWWLRSDIIWAKPNPMPESVRDRPTKAHEYLFLLTKAERYFYDAAAIAEDASMSDTSPASRGRLTLGGFVSKERDDFNGTRNRRTVWTIPTAAFSEAHFATFPTDLVKPCILAGTSARGCCPNCGAPWVRKLIELYPESKKSVAAAGKDPNGIGVLRDANGKLHWGDQHPDKTMKWWNTKQSTGWVPGCKHGLDPVPCTVLDPFGGSGTVGQVALELARRAVLIELNTAYYGMARTRCNVTPGLQLA